MKKIFSFFLVSLLLSTQVLANPISRGIPNLKNLMDDIVVSMQLPGWRPITPEIMRILDEMSNISKYEALLSPGNLSRTRASLATRNLAVTGDEAAILELVEAYRVKLVTDGKFGAFKNLRENPTTFYSEMSDAELFVFISKALASSDDAAYKLIGQTLQGKSGNIRALRDLAKSAPGSEPIAAGAILSRVVKFNPELDSAIKIPLFLDDGRTIGVALSKSDDVQNGINIQVSIGMNESVSATVPGVRDEAISALMGVLSHVEKVDETYNAAGTVSRMKAEGFRSVDPYKHWDWYNSYAKVVVSEKEALQIITGILSRPTKAAQAY